MTAGLDVAALFFWSSLGLVVYCHVGYPSLVAILALLRPRDIRSGPSTPAVTLVISAYNEAPTIARKLDNVLALDYPPEALQVIVACDGSTDETAMVARRHPVRPAVVLEAPERRGKGAAMSRGAALATANLLVFSDANAFYQPNAIRALVAHFNDPGVGLVSGRKSVWTGRGAVPDSEAAYWTYDSWIRLNESRIGSTPTAVGEILAIRRSLFDPIPEGVVLDDAYLALRVMRRGARVVYEPGAVSVETGALSMAEEFTRRSRNAAGRWGLMCAPRLWPWNNLWLVFALASHKFLRLLMPFCLGAAFAANAVLAMRPQTGPLVRAAWAGQVIFYLAAVVGLAVGPGSRLLAPLSAATYFVAGHAASLLGAVSFLTGRASPLWTPARRTTPARKP